MKIELTEKGWKEITVKYIKVNALGRELMTVGKWTTGNRKLGFDKGLRKNCNMCKTNWEEFDEDSGVNLIFTNVGNKTICDECLKKLVKERKDQQKMKRYKVLEL